MTGTTKTQSQWAERVRCWKASGLTAAAFAAREGINGATLKWWSSRLGRHGDTSVRSKVLSSDFVEVKLPDVSRFADTSIEIEIPGGVRIRVGRQFEASQLERILAVLGVR